MLAPHGHYAVVLLFGSGYGQAWLTLGHLAAAAHPPSPVP